MAEAVRYERDADGVVTLVLDQPGASVNMLNHDFAVGIHQAVERLVAERDSVRGVLVCSAKKTFFAGADLSLLHEVTAATLDEFAPLFNGIKTSFRRLETFDRPVAAVVAGAALGGGLEVALAAHRRFGADLPAVRIGFPEVTLGLLPGAGGVTRLVRMLGLQQALPLLLQGTRLRASEARDAGVLDDLAPSADEAYARARAWVLSDAAEPSQPWDRTGFGIKDLRPFDPGTYSTLAAAPAMLYQTTRGAVPAPEKLLAAAVEGAHVDIDTALAIESRYFFELLTSQVTTNMIGTFWFALNAANGGASRPADVPPARLDRVGVVGAGMMGTGIAYVSAYAGCQVVLTDVSEQAARAGRDTITALLDERVQAGKLNPAERDTIGDRVTADGSTAALAGCGLVIEAVDEDRAVKQPVLADVAAAAGEAVLASNTSTLPITGLAESVPDPTTFVGIHFFSPVHKMPLVEIIRGQHTSEQTLAAAFDFVRQLGKTPIVVNDSRGFFTSRVFGTYVSEGVAMVTEGIAPAVIENVARKTGMPVGPLAVADEVSLALLVRIRRHELADGAANADHPAYPVLETMVELGRTGKAAGAGFYDYSDGNGRKRLWPELGSRFATASEASAPETDTELARTVADRLLFIQAVEARRCRREGVVESDRDADLGSVLGIGYPAWTGGVAQFVRAYGADAFDARARELATRFGARFDPAR